MAAAKSKSKGKARVDSSSDDASASGSDIEMVDASPAPAKGKKRSKQRDDEGDGDDDAVMGEATQVEAKKYFDPHQDESEKREIRKDLRQREEKAREMHTSVADTTTAQLAEALRGLDATFDRVRAPAEATLDAKALRLYAETGALKARNMKIDANAFDLDEFVARVGKVMSKDRVTWAGSDGEEADEEDEGPGGQIDWEKMGKFVMKYSRRAPVMDVMYGPLELEQKKRKASQRQRIVIDESQRKAPTQLEQGDIQQGNNATGSNITHISKLLDSFGTDGVNLFKFIVNPHSYGQTIENLFYLSFLFNEGRAALEVHDDDGVELPHPIIFASEPAEDADRQTQAVRTRQLVLEFDQEMWEEAIDVFNITETVIPTRSTDIGTRIQGKWYG